MSLPLLQEFGTRFLSIIEQNGATRFPSGLTAKSAFEQIVGAEILPTDADAFDGRREKIAQDESFAPRSGIADLDLPLTDPRTKELLLLAELLITASMSTDLQLSARQLQTLKRRVLNAYVDKTGLLVSVEALIADLVSALRKHGRIDDLQRFYSLLGQALVHNSLLSTRAATRRLIRALQRIVDELPRSGAGAESVDQSDRYSADGDDLAPAEDLHIANAGLVLLAPWLPRLFDQLGFVQDGEFRNRDCAERAVHCVQFLADGSVGGPEYRLVLNKLLCGVGPGRPIRRSIELSDAERASLESLLTAVTQHWKALENTSIDGLRESFLQRGGRLQRRQDAWFLAVEPKAFDMLLDQVSWSYSTIKLAWMERVIYVDWR